MKNNLLGLIGVVAAPFLFVDFIMHGSSGGGENYEHSSVGGLFSLMYMSGWFCSIIGLYKIHYHALNKVGKAIFYLQFFCLSIGNCWNIYEIVDPGADTLFYHITDIFWPVSNIFMIAVALMILRARVLTGASLYAAFFVSLWLPATILISAIFGMTYPAMVASGAYSALAWAFMGFVVAKNDVRTFNKLSA